MKEMKLEEKKKVQIIKMTQRQFELLKKKNKGPSKQGADNLKEMKKRRRKQALKSKKRNRRKG